MKFTASPLLAPTFPPWRARFVVVLAATGFCLLLGRAAYLQGWNRGFLQAKGESRYSRTLELPAHRGRVLDRNGEVLAASTPVKSIWAIPQDVTLRSARARSVGCCTRIAARGASPPPCRQRSRLRLPQAPSSRRRQRSASRRSAFRAFIKGRSIAVSTQRRESTAHLLGFTDVDDVGQEGVELAFQDELAGRAGSRRVIKNRLGHVIEDVESIREARNGRDLALAVDSRVQALAYGQLKAAVETHRAKGGGIVVLDVTTGEVLALANLPSYNPNNRTALTGSQLRNRAVTDAFEPGSTLKPFTVALALDRGHVTPKTSIATAPGVLTVGTKTIRDVHPAGMLTVEQVIQKSSNVGAAKIALGMPAESMWRLFDGVGLGASPQLGFPGEAVGILRPYRTWKPVEQATMAYGHGISLSLVQLARAYTVFARDGELMPLSLVKLDAPPTGKMVISKDAAAAVRRMLELAVEPGGTAPRARVAGYRVAGKTGTAHKQENGRYAPDKYHSSFVGFAPASRPRLLIAVMLDEPSAGQHYGGAVAAPVFQQVMAGALRILGVAPDAPLTPLELRPAPPEVAEGL